MTNMTNITNFIIEYWWQIIIYLIGCVLAWGRICAITNNTYDYPEFNWYKKLSLIISSTLISWFGFFLLWSHKTKNEKFFKWLPILLLWSMIGFGCLPHNKYTIVDSMQNVYHTKQYKIDATGITFYDEALHRTITVYNDFALIEN